MKTHVVIGEQHEGTGGGSTVLHQFYNFATSLKEKISPLLALMPFLLIILQQKSSKKIVRTRGIGIIDIIIPAACYLR
jgi:hypothetical protein